MLLIMNKIETCWSSIHVLLLCNVTSGVGRDREVTQEGDVSISLCRNKSYRKEVKEREKTGRRPIPCVSVYMRVW